MKGSHPSGCPEHSMKERKLLIITCTLANRLRCRRTLGFLRRSRAIGRDGSFALDQASDIGAMHNQQSPKLNLRQTFRFVTQHIEDIESVRTDKQLFTISGRGPGSAYESASWLAGCDRRAGL